MSELNEPSDEQTLRPPPLVRMNPVEPELDSAQALAFDRHVAACLALTIAAGLDFAVADVWNAMGDLPNESVPLFHSPPGHAQIATFVSLKLTGEAPPAPLMPTVH